MTKDEKIKALATAMTESERDGNEEDTYIHFTDEASEELKDIYLEHYEVRDIDYETFSRACDIVREVYDENPDADGDKAAEVIYEKAPESANPYTAERLSYLNIWNEQEIADQVHELGGVSIADACAVWYDKQVEEAAILISNWIND